MQHKNLHLALLVTILTGLILPDQAAAKENDFFVAPSLFYYSGLRKRTSSEEKAYMVYDLKAAYQVYPELYLGFAYQGEQDNSKTSGYSSASLNNTSKGTRTSMGPTFGYVLPTFHALLTYYFDSKLNLNTTTSSGTNKYAYTGTGFQLDVGYKIELWGFWFGPQLSYKLYTYNKLTTDGGAASSISPKLEESNLEPSLAVYFFF
jgi:hypothetical protein